MRHWRLVNRMAKTTDTDLVRAFDEGRLTTENWSKMVEACRGCTWSEACDGWLDAHDSVCRAPHSCCNRARFAALRSGQSTEEA